MMQRYLSLGNVPEVRSEPGDPERGIPEIELLIPVDVFWDLQEALHLLRFARSEGLSTAAYWHRMVKIVRPYIQNERDRIWFRKNVSG